MKKIVLFLGIAGIIGCNAAFGQTSVSGFIATNTVWDLAGDPYTVTANVFVNIGVTLTIDDGVEVKFTTGTGLYIYGILDATGTTFTSSKDDPDKEKGDWNYIQIGSGSYAGTATFDECTIEYGGHSSFPSTNASVYVYSGTAEFKNNCQISNSNNSGIMVYTGGEVILSNTSISGCDWPICYNGPGSVVFNQGNSFDGNTRKAIRMAIHSQVNNMILDTVNIPYVFQYSYTVNSGGTLEISSGNIIKLSGDLVIAGTLIAVAGEGETTYFTSIKDDNLGGDTNNDGTATFPAPRSWGSIRFKPTSDDAACRMVRCNVSFGGSGGISGVSHISGVGGITVEHASPTIETCEMYNNYMGAVFQGVSNPRFRYNTIGSSSLVPLAMSFDANPVFENNSFSFSDNEYDAIGLLHGTLSDNAVLIQRDVTDIPNVTYMMLGTLTIPEIYNLTIDPGIVIKGFSSYHRIIVKGSLTADGGSPAGMITITSAKDDNHGNPEDSNKDGTQSTPATGNWGGIVFEGTSSDTSLLNYCTLKYGSMPSAYYNTRQISQGTVTTVNASPNITNCIIKDMVYGLYAFQASDPVVQNTEFVNSSKTPIAISVSADPTFSGNIFTNTGWTALGIIGENVGFNGTIKVRNVAGYMNIAYLLLEDLTINSGTNVDVEAGVVIKCSRYTGIFVDGGFSAQGTVSDSIIFTSLRDDNYGNPQDTENDGDATAPASGDWETIRFQATSDDGYNLIDHCRILYGGYNQWGVLTYTDAGGEVSNSLLSDGNYYGIRCEGTASPVCTTSVEIRNCKQDPIGMSLKSNPVFSFGGIILESNGNGTNGIRILEGTLSSDATLIKRDVGGIYNIAYIIDRLTISNDATLVINPGVVIKFLKYNSYISVDGALIADADENTPIVFTSLKDDSKGGDTNDDGNESIPVRGDWWCIVFNSSELDNLNVLNHCILNYGARDQSGWANRKDFGVVRVFDATAEVSNCRMEHAHTSALGIYGSANPEIINCEIHNVNQTPVTMSMFAEPVFTNNNTSNLGIRAIGIAEEAYSLDATIPVRNFAGYNNISYYMYRTCKINSGTTITIPAGVVFKYNHYIDCFDIDGGIVINGTDLQPVVFTHEFDDDFGNPQDSNGDGAESNPVIQSSSYCLDFADISDDASNINYTIFRYKHAAINLRQASPLIDHCSFEYNNYGVILNGVSNPGVTNNEFNDLIYSPLLISLVSYPAVTSGNQISGTTYRAMGVLSEELVQDVTLINRNFAGIDSIPYFFSGNYTIGTSVVLTIDPGVILKFNPNARLIVKRGLLALGGASVDSTIVFTSILDDFYGGDTNSDTTETVPGVYNKNWKGILFEDQSLDALCRLRYCVIQYVGWHANEAAITTDAANPTISHSVITQNKNGIRATGASNPVIDTCDIYNNVDFGVNNVNKSFNINALYCWWGSSTGPTHSSNPGGTGDVISDMVNYIPFRTVSQNPAMGDVSLNGSVQAYDASLVLQSIIGSIILNETQEAVADVSGNGTITAGDASLILQYVSGLIQSFPAIETKSAIIMQPLLTLEDKTIHSGEEFAIDFQIDNTSGISALEIFLKFDPSLILISDLVLSEELDDMMRFTKLDNETGEIKLAMAGTKSMSGDTYFGSLVCRAIGEGTEDTQTNISVTHFLANESDFTRNTRAAEILINSTTLISSPEVPRQYMLNAIYPNPFSNEVWIDYQVPEDNSQITIDIYDQKGQKILTLLNSKLQSGHYSIHWQPEKSGNRSIPGGIYYITMTTGDFRAVKKIIYTR